METEIILPEVIWKQKPVKVVRFLYSLSDAFIYIIWALMALIPIGIIILGIGLYFDISFFVFLKGNRDFWSNVLVYVMLSVIFAGFLHVVCNIFLYIWGLVGSPVYISIKEDTVYIKKNGIVLKVFPRSALKNIETFEVKFKNMRSHIFYFSFSQGEPMLFFLKKKFWGVPVEKMYSYEDVVNIFESKRMLVHENRNLSRSHVLNSKISMFLGVVVLFWSVYTFLF
ncbi:hypothetical protein KKG22_02365 [Patescibacteria group bacterium]|nr:hypothetical protein [Patescibacteria group bacterium]MBU1721804.1 hypothetical protein [Patescibacteria group bacterium]MBU1900844.1 hypothetical protein [Patescibacteria group bacterium]